MSAANKSLNCEEGSSPEFQSNIWLLIAMLSFSLLYLISYSFSKLEMSRFSSLAVGPFS